MPWLWTKPEASAGRLPARRRDFLEVYQDYQNVGLIDESVGVLQLALDQPQGKSSHPLVYYNLGYCLDILRKTDEARQRFHAQ
jgi:hypothetical protein